jgi:hypothetical protein
VVTIVGFLVTVAVLWRLLELHQVCHIFLIVYLCVAQEHRDSVGRALVKSWAFVAWCSCARDTCPATNDPAMKLTEAALINNDLQKPLHADLHVMRF